MSLIKKTRDSLLDSHLFQSTKIKSNWKSGVAGFVITILLMSCNPQKKGVNEFHGMQVPDGYTIESVVDSNLIDYPMFASFDDHGRLFLCESTGETVSTEEHLKKPPYHIRLLEDTDGDGKFEKSTVFADSLTYPKGAVFYQGSLYVASSPYLLKLTDTDGDDVADKREVLLSGWVLNHNAAALGGPFMGPDGWLYLTDARRSFDITTKEGKELKGKGARIWRCRPDGSELEWVSGGGFDNAVELVFMPGGETLGTMTYFTDPMNGFRDAIMHWVYGGVYPKPQQVIEDDKLKLTGDLMPVMTKLPRIAHSGLMRYEGDSWGDPIKGNLFSAQFNTGRIMRHIITPDGATFQTKDEPFMTATHPDIHPTDVLEDADGSLLVVNTGGWFIAGCPLSVVAKKDVRAGIFRIRKTGVREVDDPWGRKLDLMKMDEKELVKYAKDSRPKVRHQAVELLVQRGSAAIEEIEAGLLSDSDEEVRAAAIFLLYRINHPDALKLIRGGLNDQSAIVRTASAHVLGLSKDKPSVTRLMELVQNDVAPVRRQSATALGQIGDKQAVEALIKASSDPNDRFVEHAIIFSLITLQDAGALMNALNDTSSNIKKAALIALDQMDNSPLKRDQLLPLLNSENDKLQESAIWVVQHHPDWTDIVINFLKKDLEAKGLSDDQESHVQNLMIRFSGDAQLQNFIASELNKPGMTQAKKMMFLGVLNNADTRNFPAVWIKPMRAMLQADNPEVVSEVLNVIQSRSIPSLNSDLNRILHNTRVPAEFRLKALSARLMSDPVLANDEFKLVMGYLNPENETPIRQEASRLLTKAKLNDPQLVSLADDQIAKAELFLLPNLVNVYKGGKSEVAGKALIAALEKDRDRLDNLSLTEMEELLKSYPSSVQTASASLMNTLKEKQASRLQELEKLQSQLTRGDVGKGRELFFGRATCAVCHSVNGRGGDFGPDLTNVGEIRSPHDILEAVMYPSASFAREYETSKITTKTGSYTGVIKEQLPDAISIATGPGSVVRVPRAEIVSIEAETTSLMPPGLLKALDNQEISDLLSYLESLPNGLGQIKEH